jgi:hypothetical protein
MVGALLGLVLGVFLCSRLKTAKKRLLASIVFILVSVLTVITIRLTSPAARSEAKVTVREESFSPSYKVKIRIGHTKEILKGVADSERPMPFTEASVHSAKKQFVIHSWGPDYARCQTELNRETLAKLLPFIESAAKEGQAGSCFTPEKDDLGIPYNIRIKGEAVSKGTVQGNCLRDRQALVALAKEIQELSQEFCFKG